MLPGRSIRLFVLYLMRSRSHVSGWCFETSRLNSVRCLLGHFEHKLQAAIEEYSTVALEASFTVVMIGVYSLIWRLS